MYKPSFGWLDEREDIDTIPNFPVIDPPDPPLDVISRTQQEMALEALTPYHRKIFTFMVFHPVRPGEARALRRKDFNLENMTVHIQRAFSKKVEKCRKGKKDYYLPISSRFDISLLNNMLPEAFVFLNEEGRPYRTENLRRIWHRACKRAGVCGRRRKRTDNGGTESGDDGTGLKFVVVTF